MAAKRSKAPATKTRSAGPPPEDLRDAFRALRDAVVADVGRAPPRDARQSALHDAWRIALKDRVPRIRRRLDDVLAARRWAVDADGRADALVPSHWRAVIRHGLPDVAVTLAGARRQYETIALRWRERMRLGAVRGRNAPAAATKALAKQRKEAEKRLADERERERARYRETLEQVLEGWAATRDALFGHLEGLQHLTDRLQEAEEARLAALLERAPADVAARARTPLAEARRHRLDGAAVLFDHTREASRWGSLLRRWNLHRERAARALA